MELGFVRVAAATPNIRVADCVYNTQQAIKSCRAAAAQGAEIICLPELCLTGYTCGDLFLQSTLLDGAKNAVLNFARGTQDLNALLCVGAPLVFAGALYNCAVVIQRGAVLGVVPKTYLPNYAEFYEMRHFTPATPDAQGVLPLSGNEQVPFGTQLLFCCDTIPNLKLAVEICEDLWAPLPPSTTHTMAGATLVLNPSASDETVGKADYRRALVCNQSARALCAYVYCDAGDGESTTDMVFAGHNLIAENGALLTETALFENGIACTEIDADKLAAERMRNTTFHSHCAVDYRCIPFHLPQAPAALTRTIARSPFVPGDTLLRDTRCEEILTMQAKGLAKRLAHTHSKTAVIGISGGLDSCLALLVTVRAFVLLQKPLQDVIAVTMPCFGTTARTRSNAQQLCAALGVSLREVDITHTVESNFDDIGHDKTTPDITFENTQARVRTLVLMNLANRMDGLVIGTGDLSELALGWATYNGDHMSMYGVNASVPKTLMRHLVAYVAKTTHSTALTTVLHDILNTPVSPELLPAANGEISQQTEQIVGPYELHDFFLYYVLRWAFSPRKILFLAQQAFCGQYSDAIILQWLRTFYRRFFAQQFKRSCIPDGPKIGSVTLSPRGDWRMPSDACAALWLSELDALDALNTNSTSKE